MREPFGEERAVEGVAGAGRVDGLDRLRRNDAPAPGVATSVPSLPIVERDDLAAEAEIEVADVLRPIETR